MHRLLGTAPWHDVRFNAMNLIRSLASSVVQDPDGKTIEVAALLEGRLSMLVFIRHFG